MEESLETFHAKIDEEHQDIDDHITHLEEVARQHFDNEAKLLELRNPVKSNNHLNVDSLLEIHKKSYQELLNAIESIASEFRDHIQSHKI